MRIAVAVAGGLALLFAAGASRGDAPLEIQGRKLPADGLLTNRIADVMGSDTPSQTRLLVIEAPRIAGVRAHLRGRIESFEVDTEAWLELWSVFADGTRAVSRTLDREGPVLRLAGTTPPRAFALPVALGPGGAPPVRLELKVGMLGPGVVSISELRFDAGAGAQAGAWWSERAASVWGGLAGSLVGVAGAAIGILGSLGRGRRVALGLLRGMTAFGVVSLGVAVAALALQQPYAVWYPLSLLGGLCTALGLSMRGVVRTRFAALPREDERALV